MAYDIFKQMFFKEHDRIMIPISQKSIPSPEGHQNIIILIHVQLWCKRSAILFAKTEPCMSMICKFYIFIQTESQQDKNYSIWLHAT